MEIVRYRKEIGLLIKGASEAIENKTKETKKGNLLACC